MAQDQPSGCEIVLLVGFLLLLCLYGLFTYVIIPILTVVVPIVAVIAAIVLLVAAMVAYVQTYAWIPGGIIMLLLYVFALAISAYTAILVRASMTDLNAALPAAVTSVFLLVTIALITLIRPVVRRKNAEARSAEHEQRRQQDLLEAERQERLDAAERRQHEAAREEDERQERAAAEREEEQEQATRRREAAALEAERRERFRMIQSRYGDALFAWRTDADALARYAREHRTELLDPQRTKNIISDYEAFNDEDLDFVEWLRINHTDLYHRIDEVFYYRVRAIAESLPMDDKPRRPTLTPEERQAKFERYRQRALERDRIQAEDRMAAVRQKLDLLRQFREDLDTYDLDEDERDRLVKEFEDDVFTHTEEDIHGSNFKKL
jgi:hypothetical protein